MEPNTLDYFRREVIRDSILAGRSMMRVLRKLPESLQDQVAEILDAEEKQMAANLQELTEWYSQFPTAGEINLDTLYEVKLILYDS